MKTCFSAGKLMKQFGTTPPPHPPHIFLKIEGTLVCAGGTKVWVDLLEFPLVGDSPPTSPVYI